MEVKSKNFKECEICDKKATALCYKCSSYFCEDCYKYIHNNKKRNNHQKEKVNLFIPIDTKCPEHDTSPMNLFCVDENGNSIIY